MLYVTLREFVQYTISIKRVRYLFDLSLTFCIPNHRAKSTHMSEPQKVLSVRAVKDSRVLSPGLFRSLQMAVQWGPSMFHQFEFKAAITTMPRGAYIERYI